MITDMQDMQSSELENLIIKAKKVGIRVLVHVVGILCERLKCVKRETGI